MENKLIDDTLKKFNIGYEDDLRRKLDSIRIVNLIMEIEEIFSIEIKDIDFNKTNNVKRIINEYINNK